MRATLDLFGGLYQLLRLAILSKGRMRGAYWNWRMHTAVGHERLPWRERVRGIIEYGVWVHRMRCG